MGFGVPIDRWFQGELREMAYDTLCSRRARERGLFRPEAVGRLLDEHVTGRGEWHPQLWALLFLELWFQRFIDGAGRAEAPGC
jgi:asparagine synthase (glutamine-hydrolysing)